MIISSELSSNTGNKSAAYEHLHSSGASREPVVQQACSNALSETFRDEILQGFREQKERSIEADHVRVYELDASPRPQEAVDKVTANALGSLTPIENRQPSLKDGNGKGNHAAGNIPVLVKMERGSLYQLKQEEILQKWVNKEAYGENRSEIKHEITDFLNNPSKGTLTLDNFHLTSLPDTFYKEPFVSSLRKLFLHENLFTSFPEQINALGRLQFLDLSNNHFTALPASISQLRHLEILNLSNNYLTAIPASITQLRVLKFLDLSYNRIKFLPETIGQLELITPPKSMDSLGQSRIIYINPSCRFLYESQNTFKAPQVYTEIT